MHKTVDSDERLSTSPQCILRLEPLLKAQFIHRIPPNRLSNDDRIIVAPPSLAMHFKAKLPSNNVNKIPSTSATTNHALGDNPFLLGSTHQADVLADGHALKSMMLALFSEHSVSVMVHRVHELLVIDHNADSAIAATARVHEVHTTPASDSTRSGLNSSPSSCSPLLRACASEPYAVELLSQDALSISSSSNDSSALLNTATAPLLLTYRAQGDETINPAEEALRRSAVARAQLLSYASATNQKRSTLLKFEETTVAVTTDVRVVDMSTLSSEAPQTSPPRQQRHELAVVRRNVEQPWSLLSAVDVWLTNEFIGADKAIVASVPDGSLQDSSLMNLQQLLPVQGAQGLTVSADTLSESLTRCATDLLRVLKSHCVDENASYWLSKRAGDTRLRLFKLQSFAAPTAEAEDMCHAVHQLHSCSVLEDRHGHRFPREVWDCVSAQGSVPSERARLLLAAPSPPKRMLTVEEILRVSTSGDQRVVERNASATATERQHGRPLPVFSEKLAQLCNSSGDKLLLQRGGGSTRGVSKSAALRFDLPLCRSLYERAVTHSLANWPACLAQFVHAQARLASLCLRDHAFVQAAPLFVTPHASTSKLLAAGLSSQQWMRVAAPSWPVQIVSGETGPQLQQSDLLDEEQVQLEACEEYIRCALPALVLLWSRGITSSTYIARVLQAAPGPQLAHLLPWEEELRFTLAYVYITMAKLYLSCGGLAMAMRCLQHAAACGVFADSGTLESSGQGSGADSSCSAETAAKCAFTAEMLSVCGYACLLAAEVAAHLHPAASQWLQSEQQRVLELSKAQLADSCAPATPSSDCARLTRFDWVHYGVVQCLTRAGIDSTNMALLPQSVCDIAYVWKRIPATSDAAMQYAVVCFSRAQKLSCHSAEALKVAANSPQHQQLARYTWQARATHFLCIAYERLGDVLEQSGRFTKAAMHFQGGLELFEALGSTVPIARMLQRLVWCHLRTCAVELSSLQSASLTPQRPPEYLRHKATLESVYALSERSARIFRSSQAILGAEHEEIDDGVLQAAHSQSELTLALATLLHADHQFSQSIAGTASAVWAGLHFMLVPTELQEPLKPCDPQALHAINQLYRTAHSVSSNLLSLRDDSRSRVGDALSQPADAACRCVQQLAEERLVMVQYALLLTHAARWSAAKHSPAARRGRLKLLADNAAVALIGSCFHLLQSVTDRCVELYRRVVVALLFTSMSEPQLSECCYGSWPGVMQSHQLASWNDLFGLSEQPTLEFALLGLLALQQGWAASAAMEGLRPPTQTSQLDNDEFSVSERLAASALQQILLNLLNRITHSGTPAQRRATLPLLKYWYRQALVMNNSQSLAALLQLIGEELTRK